MYTKKMFSLAMAAFLSAMAVFPVYAGTEKIDTVRLEFSYDKEPESGDDITNIINEEAAAYFSGQKSAEDVAKIIQSRMQVYLSETK